MPFPLSQLFDHNLCQRSSARCRYLLFDKIVRFICIDLLRLRLEIYAEKAHHSLCLLFCISTYIYAVLIRILFYCSAASFALTAAAGVCVCVCLHMYACVLLSEIMYSARAMYFVRIDRLSKYRLTYLNNWNAITLMLFFIIACDLLNLQFFF